MESRMKKIKIPWWSVTELIIKQFKALQKDMAEQRKDDGEISKDEWKEIMAENMIELIPQLAELLFKANRV